MREKISIDRMPRMTIAERDAWIDALRSGRYKQGRGFLCRRNHDTKVLEYCCLGVFCESKGFHAIPDRTEQDGAYVYSVMGAESASYVCLLFPEQFPGNSDTPLADLNDTKHYTFDEIADWILKNVEVTDGPGTKAPAQQV